MLVVAAVSLMLCLLLFSSVVFSFCQQVSKQIVCYLFIYLFIFFFLVSVCFFFFFFFPLSLYPPFSFFSLSLSPFSVDFPHNFFIFFYFFSLFLLSLSCFLCPLVLSVIVWLNKRVYKIKLINLKKKKKRL